MPEPLRERIQRLIADGAMSDAQAHEALRRGWILPADVISPTPVTTANMETMKAQAGSALIANREFIASTPTAGQTAAQVKALSRQVNALIRLTLNQLDGVD